MTQEHRDLLENFLSDHSLRGGLPGGCKTLRGRVKYVLDWIELKGISVGEFDASCALEFQGYLLERKGRDDKPMSKNSVAGLMVAMACFWRYLVRVNLASQNPFKEIRRVRSTKKIPRELPKEDEMARILEELARLDENAPLREQKHSYRMHVMAELMYASGLRMEEVSKLEIGDVDLRRGLISVRDGKGGLPRIAYLTEYAKEVLRIYLEVRPLVFNAVNESKGQSLFGVESVALITEASRRLEKACQAVGVPKITSHGFRHSLGYHLLRSGVSVRHIQQILGHKNIRNTQIYTKVDKESLKNVVDAHHPRSGE